MIMPRRGGGEAPAQSCRPAEYYYYYISNSSSSILGSISNSSTTVILVIVVILVIGRAQSCRPAAECEHIPRPSTTSTTVSFHNFKYYYYSYYYFTIATETPRRSPRCRFLVFNTVSFHNFKSQKFKLSVSNPENKYVAYVSVLSRISNCQGLGRKNKHEILKTDRTITTTTTTTTNEI